MNYLSYQRRSAILERFYIPGIAFPCINYTLAPPPVEINEILSERPKLLTKFTESPPPTIDVAPFAVL